MGWLRHPKTTQERRRWYADIELAKEYGFKLRGKRAPHILPTLYDDIPKLNGEDRSWKMHRDTQYGVYRTKKKPKGTRGQFDTPLCAMHKKPWWFWGLYTFNGRGKRNLWPFRVRFKYIKNKTA